MSADETKTNTETPAAEATAAETSTETPAAENKPAKSAVPERRKKKPLWKIIISNPLFWLIVAIGLLIGAIEYFERYTQVGINNTYKIF